MPLINILNSIEAALRSDLADLSGQLARLEQISDIIKVTMLESKPVEVPAYIG
jgi:hypothetical protein